MTSVLYTEELFTSGQGGELVTGVPCGKSQSPANRRVIFEVDIGSALTFGEYLEIAWHGQFTNDLHKMFLPAIDSDKYTVALWTGVIISDSSGQSDTTGLAMEELTEEFGENITPNMHHAERSVSAMWSPPVEWDFEAQTAFHYVKVVAAAASSLAPTTGFEVTVNQDYGRLDVVRKTPVE